MIYVFDKPGTYIGKKSATIYVKYPDKEKKEIAVRNLGGLVVGSKVQISNDALFMLASNGISVIFVKKHRPTAVFHPFAAHGTVLTRREQILAYNDDRGTYLAKQFAMSALENKARMLARLRKNRMQDQVVEPILKDAIDNIKQQIQALDGVMGNIDDVRWDIMGIEGIGTREYFQAIKNIIPSWLGFERRERRPPKDPLNSSLSFGYTILYGEILIGIATAGLEPFAGYLHSDRSGKPSLALDLIEEFRQIIVDRLVFKLFTKKMLTEEDFERPSDMMMFTEDGKKKFLRHLYEEIENGMENSNGKRVSYRQLILRQARSLVHFLIGRTPEYLPFIMPW
ncbi:MAG: CRISPR-associated endonuclease Cas1 [Candidatus Lokiarchaeota archaeon]|nr:CRISPR-associated endonuclease Cas1 [Candidatus Lokiarchaeota archaeon]